MYVCIYDKMFHSNTKNILQKEGFNPTGKRNGQETMNVIHGGILLDCENPRSD